MLRWTRVRIVPASPKPWRRRAALLALALAPGILTAASVVPAYAADRVESISPTRARRGELVTITGRGFGAANARVTFGSVPAIVKKGTGNTLVVEVPRSAAPGPTIVTVTNPGGQGGSIAFTVIGTGPYVRAQDDRRAATGRVSSRGGSVAAVSAAGARFVLDVPAGALAAETAITLTPITALGDLPLSGTSSFAVRMQPSGLRFERPATMTVQLPAGADPSRLFAFVFNDDGTAFEIVHATRQGKVLSFPIAHFSTAGVAEGTLADFEARVRPLLEALPNDVAPTIATGLLAQLGEWINRFGGAVCTETTLCTDVFTMAIRSLALHHDEACGQAMALVQAGEPFQARARLADVMALTAEIATTAFAASTVGLDGFEQTVDVSCLEGVLIAALDTARDQALANPRAGLLFLLLDLTADAETAGLSDAANHGREVIADVFERLLTRGRAQCEQDPAAGEALLDLVRSNFRTDVLDSVRPDLGTDYYEAWAGCRIRISPPSTTVTRGKQVQFTAAALDLPSGFTFSIEEPSGNGSIDAGSGLYTAGRIDGTYTVVATSTADPARFRRATVTVVRIGVTVAPTTATVDAAGTVRFAATVTNTPNTAVRWTASGGTIDDDGVFTAGSTPGTFVVRATSVDDDQEFAEATVVVREARNSLQGQLAWEYQLTGNFGSQRNRLSANVTVVNGVAVATGTFAFVETNPFECGDRVRRSAGEIIGARIELDGTNAWVSFTLSGTRTDEACGTTVTPEPFVVQNSGSMFGTATIVNGKVVEIDFNYSETYDFPGSSGFYTQTGVLR